ncbi:MAG: hypothetical protein HC857_00495 [Synechococcales cyanobacterium RU_4_20]|nr:hypothetical protein [Synechococcales cyanobacterium RU_4_20]
MVAGFKASERWSQHWKGNFDNLGRLQDWLAQGLVSKRTDLLELTRSSSSQASGSSGLTESAAGCSSLEEAELAPTWDEVVAQLGREIKLLREAQSMTLQQIHAQTKVPLYHLRALESGQVRGLPEPIFVRGFLTRICEVLGENGSVLLAELPDLEPVSMRLAIEAQASSQAGLELGAGHLYLAYATLLAGAVGGLAWVGNHETRPATALPEEVNVSLRDISLRDISGDLGERGRQPMMEAGRSPQLCSLSARHPS